MLRATVILAAALALCACAELGVGGPADRAPEAAAPVAGAEPAPASTPAPPAEAAAPPTVEPPAAAAPPTPAVPTPAATAAATAPPVPVIAGPSPSEACAAVTANGPAREVDLDALRRILRGVDYRRGGLESNAEFRARILPKLEAAETEIVQRTGRKQLVFSLPIPAYRVAYDDAAHELWIGSELGLLQGGSAIGMRDFVLVSSSERQIGRHVATIAYGTRGGAGIKEEVTRISGDQLGVMLPGASSIGWPANFAKLGVAMTPSEAAAAKPALAVLFVGRLQDPYFVTGSFIQEPKLSDPVDKHLTVEALAVTVDCAAVYDRRTGRMIRQILPAAG